MKTSTELVFDNGSFNKFKIYCENDRNSDGINFVVSIENPWDKTTNIVMSPEELGQLIDQIAFWFDNFSNEFVRSK